MVSHTNAFTVRRHLSEERGEMQYAIELYFDPDTERALDALARKVGQENISNKGTILAAVGIMIMIICLVVNL